MLIDLSHRIFQGMRPYPGLESPRIDVTVSREASAARLASGVSFEISTLCMVANTGTYIDAPFHYFSDGPDIADLKLGQCADLPIIIIEARTESVIAESRLPPTRRFRVPRFCSVRTGRDTGARLSTRRTVPS